MSCDLCCVARDSSHKHPNANKLPQEKASCPYDRKEFTAIEILQYRGGATVEVIVMKKSKAEVKNSSELRLEELFSADMAVLHRIFQSIAERLPHVAPN